MLLCASATKGPALVQAQSGLDLHVISLDLQCYTSAFSEDIRNSE
ncbi:hypothetical protein [Sporisorium scitamineum]|uniref:Uncharacterized protein n=1 Tax=Sporisorium scitamineum TaxID=49012 RepID=A0A0F7RSG3_9BASI|nr:hypothetical protein [Sporisorium scitamineum]